MVERKNIDFFEWRIKENEEYIEELKRKNALKYSSVFFGNMERWLERKLQRKQRFVKSAEKIKYDIFSGL